MKMKRWALAMGASVATAALLAGCAGSADPGTGEGQQEGPVTLTYWDFLDPSQDNPRANALRENIAAFEADNPDIRIELAVVSLGDMLARLPQAAAAGQAPDVFKMFTPTVPQMAAAGAYSPLPDAALEVTDWLRPIDTLVGPDGEQVAVPYEYRTCALYYNEDILNEVGAEVPTTYDEVVEVAGLAAQAGYTGFGTGFSDSDNSAIIATFFDCFMNQIDQEIWGADGEAVFATNAAQEFGDFLADLRDVGALSTSVVSDTYSSVTDGLANGTTAMAIVGTERIVTYAETAPNIKWTALPSASTGDQSGTTLGWTLGIGAGSTNVDAAWRFIEYMTGPEAAARMATGGEVPTRAAAYDAPYFSTPEAAVVNSIAEYVASNSEPRLFQDNWIAVATGQSRSGQELVLNGLTGAQFLQTAQDIANQ